MHCRDVTADRRRLYAPMAPAGGTRVGGRDFLEYRWLHERQAYQRPVTLVEAQAQASRQEAPIGPCTRHDRRTGNQSKLIVVRYRGMASTCSTTSESPRGCSIHAVASTVCGMSQTLFLAKKSYASVP